MSGGSKPSCHIVWLSIMEQLTAEAEDISLTSTLVHSMNVSSCIAYGRLSRTVGP